MVYKWVLFKTIKFNCYSPVVSPFTKTFYFILKYSMEGVTCKIFIVQFTFIGISYDNKIFPLIFFYLFAIFHHIENNLFSLFQHSHK